MSQLLNGDPKSLTQSTDSNADLKNNTFLKKGPASTDSKIQLFANDASLEKKWSILNTRLRLFISIFVVVSR